MLTATDSQTFNSDRGPVTLAYLGDEGSKVWTWTFADGTVETQPNVVAMMAFKRSINAGA